MRPLLMLGGASESGTLVSLSLLYTPNVVLYQIGRFLCPVVVAK